MINFLSSWVKNLSLALIIVSILEMILPNNKIKKYVKMVMGLYILFSIIAPFIQNDKLNLDDINYYIENSIEISSSDTQVDQKSMDNRLSQIYEEELEKDILKKVEENGYEVQECKVKAHISENNSEIEKIVLKIKGKIARDENNLEQNTDPIENKIVSEIQKVEVKVSENNESNQEENEKSYITKTDIKIIKDLLIKEYGVEEKCLKIS